MTAPCETSAASNLCRQRNSAQEGAAEEESPLSAFANEQPVPEEASAAASMPQLRVVVARNGSGNRTRRFLPRKLRKVRVRMPSARAKSRPSLEVMLPERSGSRASRAEPGLASASVPRLSGRSPIRRFRPGGLLSAPIHGSFRRRPFSPSVKHARMRSFTASAVARARQSLCGSQAALTWRSLLLLLRLKLQLNRRVVSRVAKRLHMRRRSVFARFTLYLTLRLKLLLFRLIHLVLTAVVWQHFFYIKLRQQQSLVPDGAPNLALKRLVPPLEFGAMHAILFQLAILPVTMCRSLLAWLSTSTPLRGRFPFEHVIQFHVFVGYVFCAVMVVSVLLFFAFFGKVCYDHKRGSDPFDACIVFKSEIMGTGYGILICTLVVLVSAYFRNRIPFEWFYTLHSFVFIMYLLALLHTLDREFRKGSTTGQLRSQTFIWFISSLALYAADRCWSLCTMHRTRVLKVELSHEASTLVLYLLRPRGFVFDSGQYAMLQAPFLDGTWHPFSIGSEPSRDELIFFIQVMRPGSWTARLAATSSMRSMALHGKLLNLLGPYGSPVGPMRQHKVIAVGTGTGIVPMFSLMLQRAEKLNAIGSRVLMHMATRQKQQHRAIADEPLVEQTEEHTPGVLRSIALSLCALLRPDTASSKRNLLVTLDATPRLQKTCEEPGASPLAAPVSANALAAAALPASQTPTHGSVQLAMLCLRKAQIVWRLRLLSKLEHGDHSAIERTIKRHARVDTAHSTVAVLAVLITLIDAALSPLAISWSNLPPRAPATMTHAAVLKACAVANLAAFALHRIYILVNPTRFPRDVFAIVDLLMLALMCAVQVRWLRDGVFELDKELVAVNLSDAQQLVFALFGLWRIVRTLTTIGSLRSSRDKSLLGVESFHLIWVTRSGDLLLSYLRELASMFAATSRNFYHDCPTSGELGKLLDVQIYCTERNPEILREVKAEAVRCGFENRIRYERPDLPQIMESHMKSELERRMNATDFEWHQTLLTFCGSPKIASLCYQGAAAANVLASRLGYSRIAFGFREEFYGVVAGRARAQNIVGTKTRLHHFWNAFYARPASPIKWHRRMAPVEASAARVAVCLDVQQQQRAGGPHSHVV